MSESKFIFYLDVDKDHIYSFKQVVEDMGHTISVFLDGYKMIYELEKLDKLPDIIFLNSNMPILNGKEILDIIKVNEEWKHISVVMVSGAFPRKLLRYYNNVGVNHILKRPLSSNYTRVYDQVFKMDLSQVLRMNLSRTLKYSLSI